MPRGLRGTIEQGHHLEKIVAGNEPAVSGGLGSQVITHNDATPCSPGALSKGMRVLPAPCSLLAVRTALRLRSGYDCIKSAALHRRPHVGRAMCCSITTSADDTSM